MDKPELKKFVHAWGGTISLQSLECHTLRYLTHKNIIGNRIRGNVYCDVSAGHHTVYFSQKDVKRWNMEGKKLLNKTVRQRILGRNQSQIKRFYDFCKKHQNTKYSEISSPELCKIYSGLMDLVMENGALFPYSRGEITKPLTEKIKQILGDNTKLLQILITPTEDDIFLKENKDKMRLLDGNASRAKIIEYAKRNPWRFINTYSTKKILKFIRRELKETNANDLKKDILNIKKRRQAIKKAQDREFGKNPPQLKGLCVFLQNASLMRLENKKIWAGYEFLFLDLFEEIARRLGLSTQDFLYSHRIKDTKNFLLHNNYLPDKEIKKRLKYFNLEISPKGSVIDYLPKYTRSFGSEKQSENSLKGEAGNLGKAVGKAIVVKDDSIKTLVKLKKEINPGDIYITTMTHPAMIPLLHKAGGIITDEGGITSHAAVIAREMGMPCLVGTQKATSVFKSGDLVELDANKQTIRKISEKNTKKIKREDVKFNSDKNSAGKDTVILPKPEKNDTPYIIPFGKQGPADARAIGGKGFNLMLCNKEYRVPDGFCITKRLYDEIMRKYVGEKDCMVLKLKNDSLQKKLSDLQKFTLSYRLPSRLTKEVRLLLQKKKISRVAVRSSASYEDTKNASFAGQFKSFLNVPAKGIDRAILECVASAFNENIFVYGHRQKIDFNGFYLAITIQQFIDSEKAGIFFSIDPRRRQKKGAWIDANFGACESVVSGKHKPDSYFVHNSGIDANIPDYKEFYRYLPDGQVVKGKKSGRVLDNSEIKKIVSLGNSLRKKFKHEIEFEWAINGKKLYLLQVRPVTTT